MRVTLIVAVARNGVIGRDGDLPWRLPDDLKTFKRLTLGKPIVMGRKTWQSIGRPLPERLNIVMTRSPLLADHDEIMVIDDKTIYRQFLDRADRIYLTEVDAEVDGDVTFPELDVADWEEVSREHHPADERHAYEFALRQLDRR